MVKELKEYLKEAYSGIAESFRLYWRCYGGLRALAFSPYFHVSLLLTCLIAPVWYWNEWYVLVSQVLPNIVGFSIGGYAIFLAFGDRQFQSLMSGVESDGTPSPYMMLSGTFTHFVLVQITALLWAVIAQSLSFYPAAGSLLSNLYSVVGLTGVQVAKILRPIGSFVGIFLFVYALSLALAAALGILRLAGMFDKFSTSGPNEQKQGNTTGTVIAAKPDAANGRAIRAVNSGNN